MVKVGKKEIKVSTDEEKTKKQYPDSSDVCSAMCISQGPKKFLWGWGHYLE